MATLLGGLMPSAAFASLPPWYEEPPEIVSVELRLSQGEDPDLVSTLVPLRAGQRLSRHAIRRTVRLLYETERFKQVEFYVAPAEGEAGGGEAARSASWARVKVILVATARPRLAEIRFRGNLVLESGSLKRVCGLKTGQIVRQASVGDMEAAVLAAYARQGFHHTRLTLEQRTAPSGAVALLVRIIEGSRSTLAGLRLEGVPPALQQGVEAAAKLSPGQPLLQDTLDEAMDRVQQSLRTAGFFRAQVGPVRQEMLDGSRSVIHLPVELGVRTLVKVRGATLFSQEELLTMLDLLGARGLESTQLATSLETLRDRYRRLGYLRAKITATERPVGPGRSQLLIRIDEGLRLELTELLFPGAHSLSEKTLRDVVCKRVRDRASTEPEVVQEELANSLGGEANRTPPVESRPQRHAPNPCSVFDPQAYAQAREEIQERYHQQGYLGAQVGEPVLHTLSTPGRAWAEIPVSEGPLTHVQKILLEGISEEKKKALGPLLASLEPGHPLHLLQVHSLHRDLLKHFRSQGYAFVELDQRVRLDPSRLKATLNFSFHLGPQVHVGSVIVRGHRHSAASMIRARLGMKQGTVWTDALAQQSSQSLMDLGLYRSATVRLLEPDAPAAVMDVLVAVSEKKRRSVELGVGLSTEDGPRLFADYDDLAFWGGSSLELRTKANVPIFSLAGQRLVAPGPEWEARVSVRHPKLAGLRTGAIFERDVRPTYTLTRVAGGGALLRRWRRLWTPGVQVELEFDDLDKGGLLSAPGAVLTQKDRERLRLEQGQTLLVSIRPSLALDLRDNPLTPTRGALVSVKLDWSHDLGIGVPIHFLKTSAQASYYLPAAEGVTLALSGRAGRVIALSKNNTTIGPKRFFMGGADSLRGFGVDSLFPQDERAELRSQVEACQRVLAEPSLCSSDALQVVSGARPTSTGGEAFLLLKSELRFPILGDLRGGVFMDLGNIWRDPRSISIRHLRSSAGAGLRYNTPVGPMALDLGFNLLPDPVLREEALALHFAIGLF